MFDRPNPQKKRECSICGKQITPTGKDGGIQGAAVWFNFTDDLQAMKTPIGRRRYVKKQMGPYAAKPEYNVCIECYLRAMGVPEP